ncbi:MAG: hypothetical protein IJH64_02875 [Oscillospiraceae bacterium]|nr:hypothetical protein [Oscillospiraceae bacterium]
MDVLLEFMLLLRKAIRFVAGIAFFGGLIGLLTGSFAGLLVMALGAAVIAFYDKLVFYVAEKAGKDIYLGK